MRKSNFAIVGSALIGGFAAVLVIFFGVYILDGINDNEAVENLQEIRPTLRFTANAAMTSTATILALMLTLLSISRNADFKLRSDHYDRIWWIALFAVITFIVALLLLMFLNVPINTSEETLSGTYTIIYYSLISYVAVIGGLLITVVLLLYQATRAVIIILHPDRRSVELSREEIDDLPAPRRERERMEELEERVFSDEDERT